ncbi:TPA: helix-turn-helix domain-containing protein [Raoultella planticola]|uniref:YdaS family helix-turn-helix protein n=1 Tax=Raoultella planticola TaxID=575 RepID=UPI0015C5B2D8|nr:YdaS family helix-turn-helix protein [Raoultella planticola]HEC2624988.1 helix-turn-helix domain-containing protein [Raoultella planticola]HEC2630806.1 helix-turn-helix domain-containing protein [Raoultella planticola]
MTGLNKAIKIAGNQSKLASLLGISRSSVSRWVHKFGGKAPQAQLPEIYRLDKYRWQAYYRAISQ